MPSLQRHPLYALCLAALCSTNASALGVGSAQVLSPVGAPLQALIPVEHADRLNASEIRAGLASNADYQRMGTGRDGVQNDLQFRTVFRDNKPYIEVTTKTSITEPYVDFVISVHWPNGQIAREYALLLDPLKATPAPADRATAHATTPITAGSRYTTRRGDSLWKIAERTGAGQAIFTTMDAIYQANPHAFIGGNRDRLKADVTLVVPTASAIAGATGTPTANATAVTPAASGSTASTGTASAAAAAIPRNTATTAPAGGSRQLTGLQHGVTEVAAGQAATRAKVDALETELNSLIARYQALAEQTEALQQQLRKATAHPPATTTAAKPAPTMTPSRTGVGVARPATPWWVHAGYLGIIGALAAWLARKPLTALGQRLRPNRNEWTPAAATSATSMAPSRPVVKTNNPAPTVPNHGIDPLDHEQVVEPASLASAHIAFGQLAEARSVLEQALSVHPDDTALRLQLLSVHAEATDHDAFEALATELAPTERLDPNVRREIDYLRSRFGSDNITELRKNAS